MNFYQDFIVAWGRLLDLFKFKHIGGPIFLIYNCFHKYHFTSQVRLSSVELTPLYYLFPCLLMSESSFPLIQRGEEAPSSVLLGWSTYNQPHHVGHAPDLSARNGESRSQEE